MNSCPRPGDPAPDFVLDGTGGRFALSAQRGKRVVLLFYPGSDTPVCTRQFCSYRDRADELAALNAVVVGISAQSLEAHRLFVEKHGLTVPLLADTQRGVARLYGVAARGFGIRRAVIVVDEQGIVRHRHVHALGLTYQSVDDLRDALYALEASAPA